MSSEKKTPGKEESKKTNNRRANYSSSRGVTESTLPRSPEASQDPAKTMKKTTSGFFTKLFKPKEKTVASDSATLSAPLAQPNSTPNEEISTLAPTLIVKKTRSKKTRRDASTSSSSQESSSSTLSGTSSEGQHPKPSKKKKSTTVSTETTGSDIASPSFVAPIPSPLPEESSTAPLPSDTPPPQHPALTRVKRHIRPPSFIADPNEPKKYVDPAKLGYTFNEETQTFVAPSTEGYAKTLENTRKQPSVTNAEPSAQK